MATVQVGGIELGYAIEGDGDDVAVLLPGTGADRNAWAFQVPALVAAGHCVVCVDLRGAGGSTATPGPYSTDLLAQDVGGLLDALGIDRFHLVGASLGSLVAQRYALAHPARVRSLVLVSPFAAPGPFSSRLLSLWQDAVQVLGTGFVLRDVALRFFSPGFPGEHREEFEQAEAMMGSSTMTPDVFAAQLAAALSHDTVAELPGLDVPTLVLAAEQDTVIPAGESRQVHDLVPGARWATVAGSHGCVWESAAQVNQTLVDFLAHHGEPSHAERRAV